MTWVTAYLTRTSPSIGAPSSLPQGSSTPDSTRSCSTRDVAADDEEEEYEEEQPSGVP